MRRGLQGSAFSFHRRTCRAIRSPWTFPAVSTLSHREKPRQSGEPASSLAGTLLSKRRPATRQLPDAPAPSQRLRTRPARRAWLSSHAEGRAPQPAAAPQSSFSPVRLIRGPLQHHLSLQPWRSLPPIIIFCHLSIAGRSPKFCASL